MAFTLPDLPYAYDSLAPYMSQETLEYHHGKHHLAYVTNGNKLLEESPLKDKTLEEIVVESYGRNIGLFNNAAQHYNHSHFWSMMTKNGGGKALPASLEQPFLEDLGGYDKFRQDFITAAMGQFGSGWAWVALNSKGQLEIMKTPNGENPLLVKAIPILGVDVWEHSYYIDYRNARQNYVEAFIDHLINWDYVASLYEKAR